MKHTSAAALAVFVGAILSSTAFAQEPADSSQSLFGVAFGSDVATAKASLEESCQTLKTHASQAPILPIAEASETQLICLSYRGNGLDLAEAAFIFGDNSLAMVEIYGGANKAYETLPGDTLSYSGFSVKREALALGDMKADRLMLMTMDSVHPHMHYWRSPYLPSNAGAPETFAESAATPALIRFGETSETLRPEFESDCAFLAEQTIDEPWLATEPETQTQFDCFGYVYAGFPRKVEAVFGDGALEQVWILTGAAEEARVREALIAEYGPPEFVNSSWEVFAEGTVALRKDKPEVLLVSDRVAEALRPMLKGMIEE